MSVIKNEYDELAIEFRLKSRVAYATYVNVMGENIIQNPKKFFGLVNIKRKAHGYPKQMTYEDCSSSLAEVICNFFADHFQSVYSLLLWQRTVRNPNDVT